MAEKNQIIEQIKEKITGADNILVALSKNPSVDEMAAAIGLTMLLDNAGKHATAIYSGATPNALQFLKPEETFESDTNSLQDFIIALNKDKADHLRYKVEGDYVKVYITPYKTEISEKDLEFSHGDFNVDLVIAIDVKAPEELDAALSEYGRIMHDASAINITAGEAGKFADLEWNDTKASSESEMMFNLVSEMPEISEKMEAPMATAFLTGIVAATDRFSNEKTSPLTMEVASELMKKGADQKLIADNMELSGEKEPEPAAESDNPEGNLQVEKDEPAEVAEPAEPAEPAESDSKDVELKVHEEEPAPEPAGPEAAEAVEKLEEMVKPATNEGDALMEQLKQVANDVEPPKFVPGNNPAATVAPAVEEKEANDIPPMNFGTTIEPPEEVSTEPSEEVKAALAEQESAAEPEVAVPETPVSEAEIEAAEPKVSVNPDLPLPDDITLPPPPTPPIDLGAETPMLPELGPDPSEVAVETEGAPETTAADALLPKPDGADSLGGDSDPGAFQIPRV